MADDIQRMIEEKHRLARELRKRKLEEQKNSSTTIQRSDGNITTSKQQVTFNKPPMPSYPAKTPCTVSQHYGQFNQNNKNGFTQIKDRATFGVSPPKKMLTEKNAQVSRVNTATNNNGNKVIKMSVELENAKRFSVACDYENEIIVIFRKVESKQWDPISKKWSFSLKDFYQIFLQIKELNHFNIKFVNTIPESVINALINEMNKNKKEAVNLTERLDAKFVEELYDFQREGIIFGIQHEGQCLIADDMGLGKTIQAIAIAKWFRDDWPLIIVCPASLRYQWKESILRWIDISEQDIFIVKNTKDIFPKVPITITSYDLMALMKSRFTVDMNRFYGMIIMDESHYIKTDISQRTATANLIAKSCKRVILLSGTPALSKPIGNWLVIIFRLILIILNYRTISPT